MKDQISNHFTSVNLRKFPRGEKFDTKNYPSQTVPGQDQDLKTLVARHVRGIDVKQFTPLYSDSDYLVDGLENLSPIERISLAQDIKSGIEAFRNDNKVRRRSDSVSIPSDVIRDTPSTPDDVVDGQK